MNDRHQSEQELDQDDLECLAAFIDGSLDDADRHRVEALLSESEAAREVLATTVGYLESQAAETEAPVRWSPAAERARRRWWRGVVPMAAAAGLAVLLVRGDGAPVSALALAEGLGGEAPAAPVSPFEGWPAVRGGLETASLVRLGARWMDLAVAHTTGDVETARTEARRIRAELAGRAGAEEARARLDALIGAPEFDRAGVDATERALLELGTDGIAAGIRVGALRHAAAAGDVAVVKRLAEELSDGRELLAGVADFAAVDALLEAAQGVDDGRSMERVLHQTEVLMTRLGP